MKSSKASPFRSQPPVDFYELARQQRLKSIALFILIVLFYLFCFFLVGVLILGIFGLFFASFIPFSSSSMSKLLLVASLLAILVGFFHFLEARRLGPAYIIRRLEAYPPDPQDLYHKRLVNTLEEMAIAAGLPRVKAYIIPTSAINSLALVEADNSPAIMVSEGLLADFTRDELQAVLAHELAHLANGDSFTLTLVCSLADIFERLRELSEPQPSSQLPSWGEIHRQTEIQSGQPLFFLAFTLTSIIMALLSTLISREKELQADAKAVEICRSPRALARAIYKAYTKNSLIGDFNPTYSALFIVPPYSGKEVNNFFTRLFRTHPPLIRRLRILCAMIPISIEDLHLEIREMENQREKARLEIHSPAERHKRKAEDEHEPPLLSSLEKEEGKNWLVRSPQKKWEGPYTLDELLRLPFFSPRLWTKNLQEKVEARAEEFPQIKTKWSLLQQKKHPSIISDPQCPRCHVFLQSSFYEGIPLHICPRCQGKLVDSAYVNRLLVRREVTFSPAIIDKAQKIKEEFMAHPFRSRKLIQNSPPLNCPTCGRQMLPRPFTYYYVIPVDKCLLCQKIWFDTDELEILQYLIETRPSGKT